MCTDASNRKEREPAGGKLTDAIPCAAQHPQAAGRARQGARTGPFLTICFAVFCPVKAMGRLESRMF